MEFSIAEKNGLFEMKIWGVANPHGYHEILSTLTTHGKWVPGSKLIWELSNIIVNDLTVLEIATIAAICEKYGDAIGKARIAKIVPDDLVYGLNRIWEYHVFERWEATSELFRTREDAIEWLYKEE